ncbi:MAG: ribonucleoside-diphosphate reductase, adenosylcobalamin-dependent [Planctomycetes bacterium GWF2_41_51]|nr:MAG: ribonucleoside-diphosphate reductase, adenosylcobalamin-dependent [Planctomycetes bacterium GWF2_41_51]HBG27942.1 adenosylcobalamin-dependent ribonucleoside-diphosphate reductase [Phycisphaerales bacterium]
MTKQKLPNKLKKREGSLILFDRSKIVNAIYKASLEAISGHEKARQIADSLSDIAIDIISEQFKDRIPDVESIQDIIEATLMSEGYNQIAKNYIIHRYKRSNIRFAKSTLDLKDDLKLPVNTMEVLKRRYLLKDDNQKIIETPSQMFRRVALHIAKAELNYNSDISVEMVEEKFYQMMKNLEFMPNSPTLMNAGTSFGQLSACFVLPVEDSIDGIFESLKNMARIHQTGGGTGFNFSHLRPKGALVSSTKGRASGAVSFMSIFDKATGVIVQGGRRRGANMGILRCDHPDIVDFIEAKTQKGAFENFNLSVAVTDKFIADVKADRLFELKNPATGRKTGQIKARALFDQIVNVAWHSGDPGLVFIDEINRKNPTPQIGDIEATNPCGELPLLAFESCNLASINLAKMIENGRMNWDRLKDTVNWGIRFLDNVIEVNKYPLEQIKEITQANRKIGLGVMGFADMLIMLKIPYNSQEALNLAGKLMKFIHDQSFNASMELAKERGSFQNLEKSIYAKRDLKLRNATVNTIAPTGTISIIAGCSSGIEPLFAISFVRNVLSGTQLFEVNHWFEEIAKKEGFNLQDILGEIAQKGSLQSMKNISPAIKKIFVTAFDIEPMQHLQVQASFQKYTDNAVSKTINLPESASVIDIRDIYLKAHELKCKGITIYRYGSKDKQVLSFDARQDNELKNPYEVVLAESEYSGGCAAGECVF